MAQSCMGSSPVVASTRAESHCSTLALVVVAQTLPGGGLEMAERLIERRAFVRSSWMLPSSVGADAAVVRLGEEAQTLTWLSDTGSSHTVAEGGLRWSLVNDWRPRLSSWMVKRSVDSTRTIDRPAQNGTGKTML